MTKRDVSQIFDGGPAFPIPPGYPGMSLRDYFAAKALQGILANGVILERFGIQEADTAKCADAFADAMLKDREPAAEMVRRPGRGASMSAPSHMKATPQTECKAEQALRQVLDVVQRYLPPDGPSVMDAMSEIIGIVDPWPLDRPWNAAPVDMKATPGDALPALPEGWKLVPVVPTQEMEQAMRLGWAFGIQQAYYDMLEAVPAAPSIAAASPMLVEALRRIADMSDRDGNLIEMHRDELRGIARAALAAIEEQK